MEKGYWFVVRNIIKKADIVLEVLDARFPELTRIKGMEKYASLCKKPLILVINKADIISDAAFENIKKQYQNYDFVVTSSKLSKGINNLIIKIKSKIKNKNPKVAIIGYPNTGKSSLINRLSRGGRTPTSPESGYTKGLQLIKGKSDFMLFDTPGVVPYGHRDEVRLGLVSGISPSKLKEPDMVAYELIGIFKELNPSALEKAYGVPVSLSPEDFLVKLGKKWNMLMKHGLIDERRAAIQLLNDWHKGKTRL